jgi:hypothetical protein
MKKQISHVFNIGNINLSGIDIDDNPFKYLKCNINIINDCVSDNFKKCLNNKFYSDKNTHKIYGNDFFKLNDILNYNNYHIFLKSIFNMYNIFGNDTHKLFISINTQQLSDQNDYLILNEYLNEQTTNSFYFVVNCIHTPQNLNPNPKITFQENNLFIINVNTVSKHDGVAFENDIDATNIRNIINSLFEFV